MSCEDRMIASADYYGSRLEAKGFEYKQDLEYWKIPGVVVPPEIQVLLDEEKRRGSKRSRPKVTETLFPPMPVVLKPRTRGRERTAPIREPALAGARRRA